MLHEAERRRYRIVLGLVVCWVWSAGGASAAEPEMIGGRVPLFETSRDILRAERPLHGRDLGAAAFAGPGTEEVQPQRKQIDLSPVLDEIFGFLHRHGVPLQEQTDEKGHGPVGVYANFSVGRDVPAVSFHLGDRPIEPLGAFYSNERGFRCAVVWPVSRFTLRLEAGEDSEFGYYGIAGIQWLHPRRPLAIGIGIPMNLRDGKEGGGVTSGDVGFIFQLRMTLD